MSVERSVSRIGNKVYLDVENDGWSYMNRGPEAHSIEILSADEKGLKLVDGSLVGSSSGHLESAAMAYFAAIANDGANGNEVVKYDQSELKTNIVQPSEDVASYRPTVLTPEDGILAEYESTVPPDEDYEEELKKIAEGIKNEE